MYESYRWKGWRTHDALSTSAMISRYFLKTHVSSVLRQYFASTTKHVKRNGLAPHQRESESERANTTTLHHLHFLPSTSPSATEHILISPAHRSAAKHNLLHLTPKIQNLHGAERQAMITSTLPRQRQISRGGVLHAACRKIRTLPRASY